MSQNQGIEVQGCKDGLLNMHAWKEQPRKPDSNWREWVCWTCRTAVKIRGPQGKEGK